MPTNLKFSPDGKTLAFIGSLSLYLWDVNERKVQMELVNVQEYTFSADGKGLFCYKRESTRELYYYDLFQNKRTFSVPISGFLLYNLSLAGNGSMLVGACGDDRIRVWSCDGLKMLTELETGPDRIFLTAFANDTVAYSGNDGAIRMKSSTPRDAPPVLLKAHRGMIYKLLFHKEYLLSSSEDGTLRIWKGEKEYAKIEEPRGKSIQGMDLSPDGQHLAHTSESGDVYLYDLGTFLES